MSFESPLRMWAHWFTAINPLNSKSDQPLISPYNITPESNTKVARIQEMISD